MKNNNNIFVSLLIIVIGGFILFYFYKYGYFEKNVDYNNYTELNIQQMHNDYLNNEISAENNYKGNYYYVSGTIEDITSYLGDNYISFKYKYENDENKIIEINAYFDSKDKLLNLNKNDEIIVYCKFYNRTINDYMNTTAYSFHNCKI